MAKHFTRAVLMGLLLAGCSKSPPPTSTTSQPIEPPANSSPAATPDLQPVPPVPAPPQSSPAQTAFAKLVRAAEGNDPNAWVTAEQELQQLGDAVVPALVPALRSGNALERELAVMFLAQLGPLAAPAANDLVKLLKDESPVIRVNAAAVLSSLEEPPPAAIDTLIALLDESDASIRITAIASLGNAGPLLAPSATSRLEQCLADGDPRVRSAATVAIGRFGPSAKELLPKLKLLSNDEDAGVREAVTQAVQRIEAE